jgi:hypothetical protein
LLAGELMKSVFILVLAVAAMPAPVLAQQTKSGIDYRPVVSDLNAVVASWDWKQPTNGNVAMVAAIGCGTARMALREQYAAKLGAYFKSIAPPLGEKIEPATFGQAEQAAFEKAGATKDAVALLTYRMKMRPAKVPNTFDERAFTERVAAAEALSCGVRAQNIAAATQPASKEAIRHGECIMGLILGLSVGVVDAGIAVFGAEVVTPVVSTLVSYYSGSWAWDEVKEGWECK